MMSEALVGWVQSIQGQLEGVTGGWRELFSLCSNTRSTVERGTRLQPVSTTRPYSYVNHQDDEEMVVMMMMVMMMAMGMMVTMM